MNKALYFNINYMLYKKYLYFPKQQKLRVRSVLAYNLQFFLMETAEFSYLLLHSFCFNTRLCDFWKLHSLLVRNWELKRQMVSQHYCENCFYIADYLKGSLGTPRDPGKCFKNHCSSECQFDLREASSLNPHSVATAWNLIFLKEYEIQLSK